MPQNTLCNDAELIQWLKVTGTAKPESFRNIEHLLPVVHDHTLFALYS